mmetsp:Transcript_1601/g.2291  ORF Transcript_1601/g.2291 Transcript_1601/m.2291 type:complete len:214 (+) Transcript_1601:674-1315(+)
MQTFLGEMVATSMSQKQYSPRCARPIRLVELTYLLGSGRLTPQLRWKWNSLTFHRRFLSLAWQFSSTKMHLDLALHHSRSPAIHPFLLENQGAVRLSLLSPLQCLHQFLPGNRLLHRCKLPSKIWQLRMSSTLQLTSTLRLFLRPMVLLTAQLLLMLGSQLMTGRSFMERFLTCPLQARILSKSRRSSKQTTFSLLLVVLFRMLKAKRLCTSP